MQRMHSRLLPFALLLPAIAFLAAVLGIGLAQLLALASASPPAVGTLLDRLRDDSVIGALRNTALLMILIALLEVALVIGIALLIDAHFRARAGAFITICALPIAVSELAAGMVWLAILTDRGYLNSALQSAGVIGAPVSWLAIDDPARLVLAIIIAESWRSTAIVLLIVVAGLRRRHLDAAEAARPGTRDRDALAYLRRVLPAAFVIRSVLAVQAFAIVLALVGRNLPVLAGEAYTAYAVERDEPFAAIYVLAAIALSIVGLLAYALVFPRPVPSPSR